MNPCPRGCRKQVMGKPKKYAAVSGAKKDFLTVAKITRSDQIIRDLLSRLWRGSMPLQTTKLALRLR
jgi:hypothetical protein